MNIMTKTGPFSLSPLPYDEAALAPTISGKTLSFHYGKHYKAYVEKVNELVPGTRYADMTLENVVKATADDPGHHEIFNNAAQAWNHMFFWPCLSPRGGKPAGDLAQAIERDFGGYEKFKEDFAKQGVAQFGSGWIWLVAQGGKLAIEKTADAMTPMAQGKRVLLAIDVWEHAYYLDYQNRRPDYLKAVIDKLLNWDFATQNFERAG